MREFAVTVAVDVDVTAVFVFLCCCCVVVVVSLLLLLLLLDGGVGDALREGGRLEDTVGADVLVGIADNDVAAAVGDTSSSPIT